MNEIIFVVEEAPEGGPPPCGADGMHDHAFRDALTDRVSRWNLRNGMLEGELTRVGNLHDGVGMACSRDGRTVPYLSRNGNHNESQKTGTLPQERPGFFELSRSPDCPARVRSSRKVLTSPSPSPSPFPFWSSPPSAWHFPRPKASGCGAGHLPWSRSLPLPLPAPAWR